MAQAEWGLHFIRQVSRCSDKILRERKERQGCAGSRFRRCQFCRQLFSFWACGKAKTVIGRGGKLLTEWKPEIKGRRREKAAGSSRGKTRLQSQSPAMHFPQWPLPPNSPLVCTPIQNEPTDEVMKLAPPHPITSQ